MLYTHLLSDTLGENVIVFDTIVLQLMEHCDMFREDTITEEEFKKFLNYIMNLKFMREEF